MKECPLCGEVLATNRVDDHFLVKHPQEELFAKEEAKEGISSNAEKV